MDKKEWGYPQICQAVGELYLNSLSRDKYYNDKIRNLEDELRQAQAKNAELTRCIETSQSQE